MGKRKRKSNGQEAVQVERKEQKKGEEMQAW